MPSSKSTSQSPDKLPSANSASVGGVPGAKGRKGGDNTELVRVIKKYPNRRLYDTETSTYITLAEVQRLVMSSTRFVVRDAKTNDDLTRSILLQIILEEETAGAPIFTEQVQEQMQKQSEQVLSALGLKR